MQQSNAKPQPMGKKPMLRKPKRVDLQKKQPNGKRGQQ